MPVDPLEEARERLRRWASDLERRAADHSMGTCDPTYEGPTRGDRAVMVNQAALFRTILAELDRRSPPPTKGVDPGCGFIDCVNECGGDFTHATCPHVRALKRLTIAARTSGGTAGPDTELMAACAEAEAALAAAPPPPDAPIPMVLHCPKCGLQHIDEAVSEQDGEGREIGWSNPPHRSHLCHGCGHIWRPADVPTEGVAAIQTRGKADSPSPPPDVSRGLDREEVARTAARELAVDFDTLPSGLHLKDGFCQADFYGVADAIIALSAQPQETHDLGAANTLQGAQGAPAGSAPADTGGGE